MRPSSTQHSSLLSTYSDDLDEPASGGRRGLAHAEHQAAASARAAREWTMGTLGLGMMAAGVSYVAHGHEPREGWRAVAGGLAGLGLWHVGTGGIRAAAHAGDAGAHRVLHNAHLGLGGLALGQAVLVSGHPVVRLAGAVASYAGALLAADAVTDTLLAKEASWRDTPEARRSGRRWLASGLVLAGAGVLVLGWLAALGVSASQGASEAAVVARWVAAVVTFAAGVRVLPALVRRLPPAPSPAEPASA